MLYINFAKWLNENFDNGKPTPQQWLDIMASDHYPAEVDGPTYTSAESTPTSSQEEQ